MRGLVDGFRAAAREAGASSGDAALVAAAEGLLGRWSEPQRHYHTVTHLSAVLGVVSEFGGLAAHPERVVLAGWLHDAVYEPRAVGDANERASSALAAGLLVSLGVPDEVVGEVVRLVLLTAGHVTGDDDPDGALLCDADLAILAGDEATYAGYAAAVRREYAHVPDPDFRLRRGRILAALLELPSIYQLPPLRARWEQAARANLERELGMQVFGSPQAGLA